MQSKTSFFNKTIYKNNRNRFIGFPIAYFVFLFLEIILPITLQMENQKNQNVGITDIAFYAGDHLRTFISPILPAIYVILVTLAVFSYLYTPHKADMMHAFPTNRRMLYFTGFANIFSSAVLPPFFISIIVCLVFVKSGLQQLAWMPWFWFVCMVGYTLMFSGLAMMTAMLSGQKITVFIFYWIYNFLFVAAELVIRMCISFLCFGFINLCFYGTFLRPLSPLTQLYAKSDELILSAHSIATATPETIFSVQWSCFAMVYLYAAIGVVLIAVGYALYKKKALESAGDFITFSPLKTIFSVGFSFFASLFLAVGLLGIVQVEIPLSLGKQYLFSFLLIVVYYILIYSISKMFIHRTVRVWSYIKWQHFVIYAALIGLTLFLLRIDAFHVERRLPDAADIESIDLNLSESDYNVHEPDEIARVLELHQELLDNRNYLLEKQFYDTTTTGLFLNYKLEDGTRILRHYRIVTNEEENRKYQEFYDKLIRFVSSPEFIKTHFLASNYDELTATEASIESFDEEDHTYERLSTVNSEDAQKIYQALLQDIDEGNFRPYDASQKVGVYNAPLELTLYSNEKVVIDRYATDKSVDIYGGTIHSFFSDSAPFISDAHAVHTWDIQLFLTENCKHTLDVLLELDLIDDISKLEVTDASEFYHS